MGWRLAVLLHLEVGGERSGTGRPLESVTTTSRFVTEISTDFATPDVVWVARRRGRRGTSGSSENALHRMSGDHLPDETGPETQLIAARPWPSMGRKLPAARGRVSRAAERVGRDRLQEQLVDLDRAVRRDLALRGRFAERESGVGVARLMEQAVVFRCAREIERAARRRLDGEAGLEGRWPKVRDADAGREGSVRPRRPRRRSRSATRTRGRPRASSWAWNYPLVSQGRRKDSSGGTSRRSGGSRCPRVGNRGASTR